MSDVKKNYFEATNEKEAINIVNRMKKAGFDPKGTIDDHFFKTISYPCRFYTNIETRKIILDYTPYGDWKSYNEFIYSWMERR